MQIFLMRYNFFFYFWSASKLLWMANVVCIYQFLCNVSTCIMRFVWILHPIRDRSLQRKIKRNLFLFVYQRMYTICTNQNLHALMDQLDGILYLMSTTTNRKKGKRIYKNIFNFEFEYNFFIVLFMFWFRCFHIFLQCKLFTANKKITQKI